MLAVQYAQQLHPSTAMERASSSMRQSSHQRTPSSSASHAIGSSSRSAASTSSNHSRNNSNNIPQASKPSQPVREGSSKSSSHTTTVPHPPPPMAAVVNRELSVPPTPVAPVQDIDIDAYPATELLHLLALLLSQIASQNDKLSASSDANTHRESRQGLSLMARAASRVDLTTAAKTSLSGPDTLLSFHARNIPSISLDAYLSRILKYCPAPNEVFLSLLVYFDRMTAMTKGAFVIDSWNIHRLVIAGVTVASKFFSDVFYTNSRYAKVGGISQPELNQLELQFLFLNDFTLVISTSEMQSYARQLVQFSTTPHPMPSSSVADAPSIVSQSQSTAASMGAIDAYGGMVPPGQYRSSASSFANGHHKTPTDEGDETESSGRETDDDSTVHASTNASIRSAASSTSFVADAPATGHDRVEDDDDATDTDMEATFSSS